MEKRRREIEWRIDNLEGSIALHDPDRLGMGNPFYEAVLQIADKIGEYISRSVDILGASEIEGYRIRVNEIMEYESI